MLTRSMAFCWQQSHHCGIETFADVLRNLIRESSNRTIVGLKLFSYNPKSLPEIEQQSHHCGIETEVEGLWKLTMKEQQSHHCGIETPTTSVCLFPPYLQQSHHCGIETALSG